MKINMALWTQNLRFLVGVGAVGQVLGIGRSAPAAVTATTTAVAEVLLMVRVSYDLVAFMVFSLGEEFLEEDQSRGEEGSLGEHQTLDSGEGDDSEEQRDHGLDLQLEEGEDGKELLQLLLLATACKNEEVLQNNVDDQRIDEEVL